MSAIENAKAKLAHKEMLLREADAAHRDTYSLSLIAYREMSEAKAELDNIQRIKVDPTFYSCI